MILAGHGKDDRLIQVEFPIVPNVGDRIREDANSPDWEKKLSSLITEGEFIEIVEKYGETFWKAKLKNGKFALMNPEDTAIIERAAVAVLVEKEVNQSLLEQNFKVGDRVTHANELIRNGIKADFGTVTEKRFDKRKKITWMTVSWDDGSIYKDHVEGSGTLKVIESQSFKVGDRIKDNDGFIGEITFISDRCVNVKGKNSVKSYNLEEFRNFQASVEVLENDQPFLVEDFAISISGEAIIFNPNAKPVELKGEGLRIAENRELYDLLNPICNWYCGKSLAMFAVNALGHALEFARNGKIAEAVELLNAEVMAELLKPKLEVKALKEFLSSIDAVKLPLFTDAIATESELSVANLRIDEGSVSVLVEIDQPVLVENYDDRLDSLLERRDQLIASGASPKGVWINCGRCHDRDFRQAVWKSDKPQTQWGDKKSQYIGRQGGEDHLSAIAQHRAGQELRKIEREIKKLQVKS